MLHYIILVYTLSDLGILSNLIGLLFWTMTLYIHQTHLVSSFLLVVCLLAIFLPKFCITLAEIASKVTFLFMLSDLINMKMNYLMCDVLRAVSLFPQPVEQKVRETLK